MVASDHLSAKWDTFLRARSMPGLDYVAEVLSDVARDRRLVGAVDDDEVIAQVPPDLRSDPALLSRVPRPHVHRVDSRL